MSSPKLISYGRDKCCVLLYTETGTTNEIMEFVVKAIAAFAFSIRGKSLRRAYYSRDDRHRDGV